MSELTSQAAAVALIEKIELWREFAFGHKDIRATAGALAGGSDGSELLLGLYEIYRSHARGAIADAVWVRFLSVLATLLSTAQFKARWDAVQAEFPEDFRALMHTLRVLPPAGNPMTYELGEKCTPVFGPDQFIAPNAVVIGDVTLHAGVTIWFGAVLRGDNTAIVVGEESNIQDNCVLHTDPGFELRVGKRVTVGHGAILHSCDIGDDSLIGIHATVLTGAIVGRDCLIGANSLVTEGARIPDGYLAFGTPARPQRLLTDAERSMIRDSAREYYERGKRYTTSLKPTLKRR